jgi:PAS domain S-box-containing protein
MASGSLTRANGASDLDRMRRRNAELHGLVAELEAQIRGTDGSEAELAAAASVTLLDAFQSAGPVGFALLDGDVRFVRVNGALAAMNGLPIDEHEGRLVLDVVPHLWDQLGPQCAQVIATGEPVINHAVSGTTPGTGETGEWVNSFYPVRVGDRIVGIGCLVVDVTDRRRAEQFRDAVMETMVEGLYALDPDGNLTFMNAAGARMLGWTEDELRGRPVHDIIHVQQPDGRPPALEDHPLMAARRGETLEAVEDTFTRRDGSLMPVIYSAAPLQTGTGSGPDGIVCVFRDATEELAARRRAERDQEDLAWLGRISRALEDDRFVLHSQPIVPLAGGRPSEELLVRMVGDDGEIIAPCRFLPVAERYGLISEIDRWVIRRAAAIASESRRVHINLSARTMSADAPLLERIAIEFRNAGTDPRNVVFELTETALMGDWETGIAFARGLAAMGCGIALDDFGTGFGSLTYLKALPVRCLKIDIEFVRDLPGSETSQHLVRSIVHLAQGLGLETVAEGVEDEETLALLRHYGVSHAQGYHLGRPVQVA